MLPELLIALLNDHQCLPCHLNKNSIKVKYNITLAKLNTVNCKVITCLTNLLFGYLSVEKLCREVFGLDRGESSNYTTTVYNWHINFFPFFIPKSYNSKKIPKGSEKSPGQNMLQGYSILVLNALHWPSLLWKDVLFRQSSCTCFLGNLILLAGRLLMGLTLYMSPFITVTKHT